MLPQRARTRVLFLHHHQAARGAGHDRQINAAWRSKTQAQKTQWVTAYNQISAARNIADPATVNANNASAAVNAARIAVPVDIGNLIGLLHAALHQWRALRPHRIAHWQAWLNLGNIEARHPLPNAASQNDITLQAANVFHLVQAIDFEIARLVGIRDTPPYPVNAAGQRKVPERMVAGGRQRRQWKREVDAGTIGIQHLGAYFGQWIPQREFGGGQGAGMVWLKVDPDGYIVDRVFRKDVFLTDKHWYDVRLWEGNVADDNAKVPLELACHDAMMDVPRFQNVIRLRERLHRGLIDHNFTRYKLYLEWSSKRDLEGLIQRYTAAGTHVPEPFIWYVAECLARCGLAMRQGDPTHANRDWTAIVHRDLKPGNLFLDLQDPTCYADYPKPLLGDFGLAFKTPTNDPNNPRWYNEGAGTVGFLAPEQTRYVERDTLDHIEENPLDDKTNVYGFGMILWCLLTQSLGPRQPLWLGVGTTDRTVMLDPPHAYPVAVYGQALIDLVNSCLHCDPAQRPSSRSVLDSVLREVDEQADNRARGMRSGNADLATVHAEGVLHVGDAYQLGLHRNLIDDR